MPLLSPYITILDPGFFFYLDHWLYNQFISGPANQHLIAFFSVSLVVSTSQYCPPLWLITTFVTRVSRRVTLVEQEVRSLPVHLRSSPVFSGVCVARSLVFFACFVDRCFSVCPFSFVHCVVNLQILITPLVSSSCFYRLLYCRCTLFLITFRINDLELRVSFLSFHNRQSYGMGISLRNFIFSIRHLMSKVLFY